MSAILNVGLDYSAPVPLHTDIRSDKFEGFEVDLLNLISQKLGMTLNYKIFLWKDVLRQLKEGSIDIICSAATLTDERLEYLDFSLPYLHFKLCIVTNPNKDISLNSLNNKKAGVRAETEAEKYLKQNYPDNEMMRSDSNDKLYSNLLHGKIDFLIDDSPIAHGMVKRYQGLHIGLLLQGTNADYAIALRKGNTILKEKIDHVIQSIKQNGVYHHLYHKWFHDAVLL